MANLVTANSTDRGGQVSDWSCVVFQVEDQKFVVPRRAFAQHSEVFEGMFLLPRDPGTQDEPIVLHGYRSRDFAALLKVLYPSVENVMKGGWDLSKEEWIGVMRLSTIWEMTLIREWSMKELSDGPFELAAAEKVVLAREFKVKHWFMEGITHFAKHGPPSFKSLSRVLDSQTAYKILDIRSQTCVSALCKDDPDENGLLLSLADLRCGSCYVVAFTAPTRCSKCELKIDVASRESELPDLLIPYSNIDLAFDQSPNVSLIVRRDAIECRSCGHELLGNNDFRCRSCGLLSINEFWVGCNEKDRERVTEEVFQDEISEY